MGTCHGSETYLIQEILYFSSEYTVMLDVNEVIIQHKQV